MIFLLLSPLNPGSPSPKAHQCKMVPCPLFLPCIASEHTQVVVHQPLKIWNLPSCLSRSTWRGFPWAVIYILLDKQGPRRSEGTKQESEVEMGASIHSFFHLFNTYLWILLFSRDFSRYWGYLNELNWRKPCCYGVTFFTFHASVGKTTKEWDEKVKYILCSSVMVNKRKIKLGSKKGGITMLDRGARKDILRR